MKKILLGVILLIAAFTRLYQLGLIPKSMSDDEIREVYSSYAIAKTGRDIFGTRLPLSFNLDGFAYAPVPIYIGAFTFKILPINEYTGRLPYAIAGIATVLFFYLLVKQIFYRSKFNGSIALIAAALLSLSPWHIHISRFSHEGIYPLLFYLAGLWMLFKSGKKDLLSVTGSAILFFLGFYSYAATKIVYIPLVIAALYWQFKNLNRAAIAVYISIAAITLLSFLYLSKYQGAAQYSGGQIFLTDITTANLVVGNQRQNSQIPEPFKSFVYNKLTYWGRTFIGKYSYAFSAQYLFTDAEASGIYSLVNRGQLYLIELPLILAGLIYLFIQFPKIFILILSFILISPLPSALGVSRPTYTHRSEFLIPWLFVLAACGIYYLSTLIRIKFVKAAVISVIFIVYIFEVGNYLQKYYYEWVNTGARYFSEPTKDLIFKLNDFQDKQITVLNAPTNLIEQYAFYHRLDPILIQKQTGMEIISLGNVRFIKNCNPENDPLLLSSMNNIYVANPGCLKNLKPADQIKEDGQNVIWNIYEIN